MKRYILLLLICLPALAYSQAKTTSSVKYTLRGVVTYYFNATQGDKADVGAKAYIIKATTAKALGVNPMTIALSNLKYAEAQLSKAAGVDPTLSDEELTKLDTQTNKMKNAIVSHASTSTVTADGSGVFQKKLSPGRYYVLIVSASRRHDSTSEQDGQLQLEDVIIKNDDVEISARFTL
jgi:flagellar hook assembly protein FlgD